MNNRFERILTAINSNNFDIISFDFFDTIINRKVLIPTDIFKLVENKKKFPSKLGCTFDFYNLRIEAEKRQRNLLKYKNIKGDPCIDGIYQCLKELSGIEDHYLNIIKNIEVETEIEYTHENIMGIELYKRALKSNKIVIITSDMYLSKTILIKILENLKIDRPDNIFVSSEMRGAKKDGYIFRLIEKELNVRDNTRILHIGDNIRSDVKMPEKYGWKAFWMQKQVDYLKGNEDIVKGIIPIPSKITSLPTFPIRTIYSSIIKRIEKNLFLNNNTRIFEKAEDFGYIALGPLIFSLVLWIRQQAVQRGIEEILFFSRDGYLPKIIFEKIEEYHKSNINLKYVPISRKMLIPYIVNQPGGLEKVTKIKNHPDQTIENFVKNRFGVEVLESVKKKIKKDNVDVDNLIDNYKLYINKVLNSEIKIIKNSSKEKYKKLIDYYNSIIDKKPKSAIFDVGRKGTFQALLSEILKKELFGFYIVNDYSIYENVGNNFINYLGVIDKIINNSNIDTLKYEVFLSETKGGYIGIDENGELERDKNTISIKSIKEITKIQDGALEFCDYVLNNFSNDLLDMKIEPFYASYAIEHLELNLESTKILKNIEHEDSISLEKPRNIINYLLKKDIINNPYKFKSKKSYYRILIFCPAITRIRGGAEKVSSLLANYLNHYEYELLIVSTGDRKKDIEPVYEISNGISIRIIKSVETKEFSRIVKAYIPDVALILASGPNIINLTETLFKENVPILLSERTAPEMSYDIYWKTKGYNKNEYIKSYENANTISVQLDSFKNFFPKSIGKKIVVLPNPIEIPSKIENNKEKVLICVGRIRFEHKRQDILLEAFAKIHNDYPEWKLEFYGHYYGKDGQELKLRAEKLKLEKYVYVSESINDIKVKIERASVFVLPSKFEGFPNALAEALSYGLPSIGFESCLGTNELIKNRYNGLLVKDKDLNDCERQIRINRLAEKIEYAISDEEWRKYASKNARIEIKKYEKSKILTKWKVSIESLINENNLQTNERNNINEDVINNLIFTKTGDFKIANYKLRKKEYVKALKIYLQLLLNDTTIKDEVIFNIFFIKNKLKKTVNYKEKKAIFIVKNDNIVVVKIDSKKIYKEDMEHVIEKINEEEIFNKNITILNKNNNVNNFVNFVINNPINEIIFQKPIINSCFIGLLYKIVWNTTIVLYLSNNDNENIIKDNVYRVYDRKETYINSKGDNKNIYCEIKLFDKLMIGNNFYDKNIAEEKSKNINIKRKLHEDDFFTNKVQKEKFYELKSRYIDKSKKNNINYSMDSKKKK